MQDFSTFSFTHVNQQPSHGLDCDPLSPVTPIQTPSLLHVNDSFTAPAPLTIPNLPSFLMDDWSQSSSPVSQYDAYDAYSSLSPVDSFDAHFTFDTHSFETLDLDRQQQHHGNDAAAFTVTDPTSIPSIDDLSLGQHSDYDLGASAELNLLDMGMGGANLVPGFDATQYLDLLAQPTCSPCSQQRYQHQHQPAFIPTQHHQPQQQHHHHHIPP